MALVRIFSETLPLILANMRDFTSSEVPFRNLTKTWFGSNSWPGSALLDLNPEVGESPLAGEFSSVALSQEESKISDRAPAVKVALPSMVGNFNFINNKKLGE